MEEKSQASLFFLYRLCKVIINRYKQTNKKTLGQTNLLAFLKSQNKKKILRHHKRTLSNAIIVYKDLRKGVITNCWIMYLFTFFLKIFFFTLSDRRDPPKNDTVVRWFTLLQHQWWISVAASYCKCVFCGAILTLRLLTKTRIFQNDKTDSHVQEKKKKLLSNI